jgi:flagellar biosynthesis protein FlhG
VIGLADYVVVVTSFEPAAVVDAYAVIKLIWAAAPAKAIGVLVNSARDAEEGNVVFRQISTAAERFLHRSVRYDGYVLEDRAFKESQHAQIPCSRATRRVPASRCIRRLACRLPRRGRRRPVPGLHARRPICR